MSEFEQKSGRFPKEAEVTNFITGEECKMRKFLGAHDFAPKEIEWVAEMCSEATIKKVFFGDIPEGQNMSQGAAKKYLDDRPERYAARYAVYDPSEKIVAFVNIKLTDNPEAISIGYMASEKYPGIMTNTVLKVVEMCRELGYKKIVADCLDSNSKSKKVLDNAHFSFVEKKEVKKKEDDEGRVFCYYELVL